MLVEQSIVDPLIGETFGGRYLIEEFLGGGAASRVYRAAHTLTNRPVALKRMNRKIPDDPSLAERMLREARVIGKLHHPGIVEVFDAGEWEGHLVIVMELIEGESLESYVSDVKVPFHAAVERLFPALEGLQRAHELGIIHRDIKPSNIMVVLANGIWSGSKLVDFGAVKFTDDGDTRQTSPGSIVGTPDYAAPEQLSGEEAQAQTDIYQVGTLLYELLTGSLPFEERNLASLGAAKLTTDPRPPSQLLDKRYPQLERLDLILMRALARKPESRQQSVADLLNELKDWIALVVQPVDYRHKGSSGRDTPPLPLMVREISRERPSTVGRTNYAEIKSASGRSSQAPVASLGAGSIFGGLQQRVRGLDQLAAFNTAHIDSEYKQLSAHVDSAHRMWLLTVALFVVILLAAVLAVIFGNLKLATAVCLSNVFVGFLSRMLSLREDHYREVRARKDVHLSYGQFWVMSLQTIDSMPDGDDRRAAHLKVIEALVHRLRAGDVEAPVKA